MRCSRSGITLPALVLALWPCASLLAQDYEIHLHRPQIAGQKYHLSASGRSTQTRVDKSGDKILRNDSAKFSVECECTVTVLAVDAKGKPSKLSLEIERLSRTDDSEAKELMSKGSVVTVGMKDGMEVSEMDGHRLSLPTQEALTVVLPLDPNGPTDDELYGTSDRKKPGDHWDANIEAIAKDLLRRAAMVKQDDLIGTVSFEKLVKVGQTDCLQINGLVDCSKYVPEVPRGVKVEKGFLRIGFTEKLPVAASMPAVESSQTANVGYTLRGRPDPAGDEITIDVGAIRNSFSRVTNVQEAGETAPK